MEMQKRREKAQLVEDNKADVAGAARSVLMCWMMHASKICALA
jgi:hypothetical protein